MAELVIGEPLAKRLRELARREQRPVEDVLEDILDRYAPTPPAPQVPEDEAAAEQEALAVLRPKLYRMAREYWRRVGDEERLALTDEELDEQFWLIDHEGIPRLKSEQGQVELPPDPLEAIDGIFDDDIADMSTTVRETLAAHTHPQYGWTKRGRID